MPPDRTPALEALATGRPLAEVLERLVARAEARHDGLIGSILLLDDGGRLRHGAAPSLPESYVRAIDGLEIGPQVGSCGAAAALAERVVVEDVLTHPNWAAYRDLAAGAGLRACWSEPIRSSSGAVLGTFAMYYREPRRPTGAELDDMRSSAHLAGVAIESKRSELDLRQSEENFRQLAEHIREVFWLTDWEANEVLYVSPAYETIYGCTVQSLYDDPRSWTDVIHPDDRERAYQSFCRDAQAGDYDIEYRIVRPDGELRWIHDRAFPIRSEDGRVYRMAGLSEDVTERKRAERELAQAHADLARKTETQLRSLTTEVLLAEERERRNVAVDLHEGLGHTLTLALMKLQRLRGRGDAADAELAELETLIEQASQSARSLTWQICPPVLYDIGFEAALEWLVEDMQQSYGLEVRLTDDGESKPLDERVRVMLFRAVRELLVNVAKHAHATHARVAVTRDGTRLRIEVIDDGVAFVVGPDGTRGLGLFTIRQRLSHLGGSMGIVSEPGKGTTIRLVAPLRAAGALRERTEADERVTSG